jgi:hypothetical protein
MSKDKDLRISASVNKNGNFEAILNGVQRVRKYHNRVVDIYKTKGQKIGWWLYFLSTVGR